jgi:hypothetical protein
MIAGGTDFVGGRQEIVSPGPTTTAVSPSERLGNVRVSVQLFVPPSSGTAHTVWSVALLPVYRTRQSVFGSALTAPAVSQQPPVHAGGMERQAARSTIGRRDRSISISSEPPSDGKTYSSRSNLRSGSLLYTAIDPLRPSNDLAFSGGAQAPSAATPCSTVRTPSW